MSSTPAIAAEVQDIFDAHQMGYTAAALEQLAIACARVELAPAALASLIEDEHAIRISESGDDEADEWCITAVDVQSAVALLDLRSRSAA